MPYIDIHNINYEDTLYKYTTKLENGRYDIISINAGIDDYNTKDALHHSMNYDSKNVNNDLQYYYNSYSTYRRSLVGDDIKVILNETNLADYKQLLYDNYYNTNPSSNTNIDTLLNFEGIAVNYYYPCNGRLASLEDIFVEYGYDYVVAFDKQYYELNNTYYYFDPTLSAELQFTYEILTREDTYTTEDGIDTSILYDGTTVPTVEQILSGQVYIIIKSGNQVPRKIYFNNSYMPSLFVNDDKYNLKSVYPEKEYTDNIYKYILIDNQPMKLCDITRRQSYGYTIQVEHFNFYAGTSFDAKQDVTLEKENGNKYGGLISINFSDDIPIPNDFKVTFTYYAYGCLYNTKTNVEYGIYKNEFSNSDNSYSKVEKVFGSNEDIYDIDLFTKKFGPVSRPKTDGETGTLQLYVVPVITINYCQPVCRKVTSTSGTAEALIYKDSPNSVCTLIPIINDIKVNDVSINDNTNPDSSINQFSIKDIVDVDKNNIKYKTAFGNPPNKEIILPDNFPQNQTVGFSIEITNIPYVEFAQYVVPQAAFDILFEQITVNISNKQYSPGFFYPNEYEPVWLEPASNLTPVFLVQQ